MSVSDSLYTATQGISAHPPFPTLPDTLYWSDSNSPEASISAAMVFLMRMETSCPLNGSFLASEYLEANSCRRPRNDKLGFLWRTR